MISGITFKIYIVVVVFFFRINVKTACNIIMSNTTFQHGKSLQEVIYLKGPDARKGRSHVKA